MLSNSELRACYLSDDQKKKILDTEPYRNMHPSMGQTPDDIFRYLSGRHGHSRQAMSLESDRINEKIREQMVQKHLYKQHDDYMRKYGDYHPSSIPYRDVFMPKHEATYPDSSSIDHRWYESREPYPYSPRYPHNTEGYIDRLNDNLSRERHVASSSLPHSLSRSDSWRRDGP